MTDDDDHAMFAKPLEAMATMLKLKPAKGDRGEFKCPKCGGVLAWQYNGPRAFRGWCKTTAGCIGFMS